MGMSLCVVGRGGCVVEGLGLWGDECVWGGIYIIRRKQFSLRFFL